MDARRKLEDARAFAELALFAAEDSRASFQRAAVSLAVVGGIAASDAACCHALGERSRSQDHRDAATLLESVGADGKKMAKNLRTLVDLKDKAQYGLGEVSTAETKSALRALDSLIKSVEKVRSA